MAQRIKQPQNVLIYILLFLTLPPFGSLSRVFAEDSPQIKNLSGEILIDSKLEVSGVLQGNKYFELVETSTPTAPSANHAKIWLNTQGSTSALKIIFDDSTVVSIAAN